MVEFKEKSEIFNSFFTEECSPITNLSVLTSQLTLLAENSIVNCHFSNKGMLQIIRNLGSNKAQDMINNHILKEFMS